METNNWLGTFWAALGMTGYYLALVWINTLLGLFLTPLFLIPLTWLQDRLKLGKQPAPVPVPVRAEPRVEHRADTRAAR